MQEAVAQDKAQAEAPTPIAFEISPNYVSQLITNQAASLDRALLELVANAIDAGASHIAVEFDRDGHISVTDDGRGFSEQQVREHFGTFGFDHATVRERAEGRTLGTFGIGRGQIMGLAAAKWHSGTLVVETDLRRHGLRYLVRAHGGDSVAGCRVEATLYERLLERARRACVSRLAFALKWAKAEITIDARRVSQDPATKRWTTVTDALRWLHQPGTWAGVHAYHGGVLAQSLAHSDVGVSGTLVAREGHCFEVSTTRSEILRERCPLWTKARVLLKASAQQERATRALSDEDRAAVWHALLEGHEEPDDYLSQRLLKTVHPRYATPYDLARRRGGRIALALKHWVPGAEQVQREEVATVLGPDMAAWLRADDAAQAAAQLNAIFGESLGHNRFSAVDLHSEIARLEHRVKLLATKELTRTERAALAALRTVSRMTRDEMWRADLRASGQSYLAGCHPSRPQVRRVRIGIASGTAAWTDGASYVAIERRRLRRCLALGLSGWCSLAILMRHEYAHIVPTEDTAEHDLEFYRRFHDGLIVPWVTLVRDVLKAVRQYTRERERLGLKPPREVAAELESHHRQNTPG